MGESKDGMYVPQKTAEISVKPEGRDVTEGRPFPTTPDNTATVTLGPTDESHQVRVSVDHGRDTSDSRISNKVLYQDEHGTLFGDRNNKGADMASVELREDEVGYLRLRIQGMKDAIGLQNIKDTSDYMRKNGLPTERIASIRQVEEVYVNGEKIPIAEFKARIIQQKEDELAKLKADDETDFSLAYKQEELERIKLFFATTEFYVVERDLQVAERVRDLTNVKTKEDLLKMMEPALNWLNVAFKVKKEGIITGTEAPELFTTSDEDLKRYFSEWLPQQMGTYLGRLHKLRGIHGYAHGQNYSLAGTMYDLDSVRFVPKSPRFNPVSEKGLELGQEKDVATTIRDLVEELGTPVLLELIPNIREAAVTQFVLGYIKERYTSPVTEEQFDTIITKYFAGAIHSEAGRQINLEQILHNVKQIVVATQEVTAV